MSTGVRFVPPPNWWAFHCPLLCVASATLKMWLFGYLYLKMPCCLLPGIRVTCCLLHFPKVAQINDVYFLALSTLSRIIPRRATTMVFTKSDDRILVGDKSGDVYEFSVNDPHLKPVLIAGHVSMLLDMVYRFRMLSATFIIDCNSFSSSQSLKICFYGFVM